MIKVDATSKDPREEELFGIFLIGVLSTGPVAIAVQSMSGLVVPILRRAVKARADEKEKKRKATLSEEEAVFEATIGKLEMKKTKAVKDEDFEKAIKYRDEIRALKAGRSGVQSAFSEDTDPISEAKLHGQLTSAQVGDGVALQQSQRAAGSLTEKEPHHGTTNTTTPVTPFATRGTPVVLSAGNNNPSQHRHQLSGLGSRYAISRRAIAPAPSVERDVDLDLECEEL